MRIGRSSPGGANQGFWLIVERFAGKRAVYAGLPRLIQIMLTFVLVIFGWVLLRAENIGTLGRDLGETLGL